MVGEEISAKAKTDKSANLTMTKEYLVVKGKHYQIKNTYLYGSSQVQAVRVKDILSMEYLTMRSKRLFILFMILMTCVVFGGMGVRKLLSAAKQIDKEVQKIEYAYNYVVDEDIDINVTSTVENLLTKVGVKGIVTIYILLITGSAGCFILYFFKPFHVLYISTLGKIIAVERKFYNKSDLDGIIQEWKKQLQ